MRQIKEERPYLERKHRKEQKEMAAKVENKLYSIEHHLFSKYIVNCNTFTYREISPEKEKEKERKVPFRQLHVAN